MVPYPYFYRIVRIMWPETKLKDLESFAQNGLAIL